jgi:2-polyprenyl-3-methyl-5-hydroxy-6-metoxy-1,4-benzoquinol methylase
MSLDDRNRWDRQHAESSGPEEASSLLQKVLAGEHWQIPSGRALDIACGKGRNALFLAARGFDVTAVDVSGVGLDVGRRRAAERNLQVTWMEIDLEQDALPASGYDLVVNVNYLQRALTPKIKAAVKSGGSIIFETYLIDQRRLGHPKNPDYLLAHNELLNSFSDFRVLFYREGKFADGREASFRAGLLAQKPA